MGYPAIRDVIPAEASHPIQEPPVAQAPPRPAAAKPAADQGPLTIPGRSRRSGGTPLPGPMSPCGLVFARLRQPSRSSSGREPMAPATPSSRSLANAQGRSLLPRPLGIPMPAAPSRRYTVLLRESVPCRDPPDLDQPTKWTITVLGTDDQPIGGLRLAPRLL